MKACIIAKFENLPPNGGQVDSQKPTIAPKLAISQVPPRFFYF